MVEQGCVSRCGAPNTSKTHKRAEGGCRNKYHTRDELHRVPEGLCHDVVLCCERGHMVPLGID